MSASIEELEGYSVISLEGACNLASAVELKRLLVEGLTAGKPLRLDLAGVEEIDIPAMQLLWAAGRDAARTGGEIAVFLPEAAVVVARQAGFEQFPGLAVRGGGWPR